jgi:hypothetical protein
MNNQEISIRYENPCADLCKIIILESSSSEEIENALKSIHQLLKGLFNLSHNCFFFSFNYQMKIVLKLEDVVKP